MRKKLFIHKKANAGVGGGFKIEIQTTSDGQSFTLPLVAPATIRDTEGGVAADYGYDCVVNWGDGNTSSVQAYNDANIVHSYETAGVYNIEIKGQCDGWSFNNGGSKLLITKIKSWGGEDFEGFCYLRYGFRGCTNLASLPANQGIKRRINIKNLQYLFYQNPIAELPADLFRYCVDVTDFCYCFQGCSNLTSIPADLFRYCVDVRTFGSCFQGCSNLTELPADLFRYCVDVTSFSNCFRDCSNIASIPSGLFDNNMLVTSFQYCFRSCSNLTSIPADLFRYNTKVINFENSFYACSNLTSIPADLFRYCVDVTSFGYCFRSCSNLTSIPADLFRYCVDVTDFIACFQGCSNLTELPADLFRYNTKVIRFENCFQGCSNLTELPADLFRYCVDVTIFSSCFGSCKGLTTLPANLFKYNAKVVNYSGSSTGSGCFEDCIKLQIRSDIFDFANFLNKNMNLSRCFYRTSFTGIQGTAPALWEADYGTGTPIVLQCFRGAGNSATSLTNYADIPAEWK